MTLPCTRDPELWFSDQAAGVREAKRICLTECQRTAKCLAWAVAHNVPDGIWGATTGKQRRPLVKAAGTGGKHVPHRVDPQPRRGCEVAGCTDQHFGLGMCRVHYLRAWRARKAAA